MPTSSSPAIASSRALREVTSRCSITASMSWSPTLSTGFSDVIGSWKIIEISLPRSARSRDFEACRRFSPRNSACPVEIEMCFFDPSRNAAICSPGSAPGAEREPPRLRVEAEDRHHRHALARAGLADDAERRPGLDGERDAVDRPDDPVVGLEVRAQVAHLEERRRRRPAARSSRSCRRRVMRAGSSGR